jgi:hypothetical protein
MPNLTSYPAIDVAIGLVVMFFVLSVVCSAIQELLATLADQRAKDLRAGLREILDEPTATAVEERLPGDRRSYIDPRQFSLALLDTLAPGADHPGLLAKAAETAATIENPGVKGPLVRALKDAQNNVAAARTEIEAWFNASMDRVSGTYKRRVQYLLLAIAAAVAIGANADTFQVANKLWADPALRASLVSQSNQILQQGGSAGQGGSAAQGAPVVHCPGSNQSVKTCIQSKLDNVASGVDSVDKLKLPIGWTKENTPNRVSEWVAKVFGLLITILALSLGAPFWFDVLGKLSRLRATGAKPAGSDTSTNEPKTA